jgi:heme oxygenase-like protein
VLPLPTPRGPLTAALLDHLGGGTEPPARAVDVGDPRTDDDLQLALFLSYELHYGGIAGVADDFEWSPEVIAFRRSLELAFEGALREAVRVDPPPDGRPMVDQLRDVVRGGGADLQLYLARAATVEHFREFALHRSAYHLKEADPFTWLIPRIAGRPKAALVEIQADEYGGGDPAWMHSRLFADMMRHLGLDPELGPPLEELPGSSLAVVNLLSMFGLQRRLRGESAGALAVFEMTSCIPNRRYGDGMRRLGFGDDATRFFDEHVEADAVHEAVAATDLAGALAADEPMLAAPILFGAHALRATDDLAAAAMLDAWRHGHTSLRAPTAAAAASS